MSECDEQLLGAYFDNEFKGAERERLEKHLRGCTICAHHLEQMRETSQLISRHDFGELSPRALADLHAAIDSAGDRQIWRIGGSVGLVAASVLIVGLAWLRTLPPAGSSGPSREVVAGAPVSSWERTAMTLRADPLLPQQAAESQLAEADWMLEGLLQRVQQ